MFVVNDIVQDTATAEKSGSFHYKTVRYRVIYRNVAYKVYI